MKLSQLLWYLFYAVPVVLMFLIAWLGHRKPQHFVKVSTLIDHIMVKRTTRIAIVTVWWWLGWHFFSD